MYPIRGLEKRCGESIPVDLLVVALSKYGMQQSRLTSHEPLSFNEHMEGHYKQMTRPQHKVT